MGATAAMTGNWLGRCSPAFRLLMATSWLAPEAWRQRQNEAILGACDAAVDWVEYIALVERHRTPAMSWAALKRVSGITIPEGAAKTLKHHSDACRIRSVIHLQLLMGVLKGLDAAGISAMPLKGPLLSFELYGDAGLRESKDLDVLIPRADLPAARLCLCDMGWHLRKDDSHLTPRQSEFRSRHEHHVSLVHTRQNAELELHWRSTHWGRGDAIGSCWATSIASKWQGYSYCAMNSVDLAVHLCDHGGGHAWFRAKWLGDMARMLAERRIEAEAVLERARALGQERPVLQCLRLLRDGYGLPMPAVIERELSSLDPLVIERAVQKLTDPVGLQLNGSLRAIRDQIRYWIYVHRLWPHLSIGDTIADMAIFPADFELIRLSDRLFWLYVPLRPVLWAWRHRKKVAV